MNLAGGYLHCACEPEIKDQLGVKVVIKEREL